MKTLIASLTFAVAGVALAAVPGTYTARDYEQNGLVAQWDGREYCAYDVHPASGTYWVDLIGRRNVFVNGCTYTEEGASFSGNSAQWAKSYCGDLSCFNPTDEGITVEVTVTLTSATRNGGILTAPLGTGVAIYQNQGKILLASKEKGAQPVLSSFVTGAPQFVRLSVGYRNGEVVDSQLFSDGVAISRDTETATGPAADEFLYVCKGGNAQGQGIYHSIRVYNRLLKPDEVAKNAKIDWCRFAGSPCFEVVSGSVTADGVTYAAGEKVYSVRNTAAEITAATDVVIRPAAERTSRLSVSGCTVALEPVATDEMVYVESLALGANAVLTLPATGLGLNAATLTADATALVAGTGLLVSAAETSPVALGADVTYRSAGGTFAGWPTSGVAYVPVGSAPTIATADDVAKVEALSAIVFLDDGTDAADATTVSCSAADGLTLSAKLNGPGVFASSSGGGVTVTGNNAKFLGNFDFSGVNVTVSDEYGLGSSVTRTAKIVRNQTSSLVFDDGVKNVFTNYAKIWINNADKNSYRVIGSASAEKKLVQAETLDFGNPPANPYVYLDYNIDLLKGYRTRETSPATHPRLSAKNPGVCHIYGEIFQAQSGHGFLERANVYLHQASYKTDRMAQGAEPFVCGAADVFVSGSYQPNGLNHTLDLNGFDQHFTYIASYNNASAAETGDPTHIVHSATSAKIILTAKGDKAYTERPKFTGWAGIEHATPSTYTNVFAGVECTSKGELKMTSGTLVLKNGYAWVGKKVTMSGGRLVLDSAKAISGGNATVTFEADGVLEIREGAGCVVNKLVCGDTTVETPGDYTIATLQGLGLPIEGSADFVVKVVRSYDVEWTGWPTTPGATAVVPQNTAVVVTEDDVANVAALAAIDIGPGGSVTCSGLASAFPLPKVMGFGEFVILNTDGYVLDKDNSGLLSPGGFLISNSCVIVSNRYGLGCASTAAARIYCCAKDDVLSFGGEGLTNDVALQIWQGTGANGGIVLGSKVEGEVFVQNAGYRLVTGTSFAFRNFVRFTNGTVTYDAKEAVNHFRPGFVKGALAKEIWFDAGSCLDAGGRRCFFPAAAWHFGGSWKSGQLHPDPSSLGICERVDVLKGLTWSPYAGATLDLNGYDQGGLIWAPEYDSGKGGSVVTSAVPAKVTITATSYSTDLDSYAVAYRGEAGLTYAPTSGKSATKTTTWVNRFSDTIGPLEVAKGTLVFSAGAGWGGTNVTIRSGATLQIEATSAACAFKQAGKSCRTNLVIEDGGTLNLVGSEDVVCRSLVYNGNVIAPGRYTTASNVGIAGAGTLVVRKTPGEYGLSVIIR